MSRDADCKRGVECEGLGMQIVKRGVECKCLEMLIVKRGVECVWGC